MKEALVVFFALIFAACGFREAEITPAEIPTRNAPASAATPLPALKLRRDPILESQIAEIALASGFENRCAFSRLFRERFGVTAGAVRRGDAANLVMTDSAVGF